MRGVYYNEIDPFAAEWLRELMKAGLIPDGEVDERDIREVQPDDVRGFFVCHWFAGIGGWPYALSLAGWPEDRPVWTGSCPCQPFSAAGKRGGYTDTRDLWPAWFRLIAECRPATILGEQVAGKAGLHWLDLVYDDVESCGYAVAACDLPAASVGAPHIRQRLYFVAESVQSAGERDARGILGTEAQSGAARVVNGDRPVGFADGGEVGLVADCDGSRRGSGRTGQAGDGRDAAREQPTGFCASSSVDNAPSSRRNSTGQGSEGEARGDEQHGWTTPTCEAHGHDYEQPTPPCACCEAVGQEARCRALAQALNQAMPYLKFCEDTGPPEEGCQSPALLATIRQVALLLAQPWVQALLET